MIDSVKTVDLAEGIVEDACFVYPPGPSQLICNLVVIIFMHVVCPSSQTDSRFNAWWVTKLASLVILTTSNSK